MKTLRETCAMLDLIEVSEPVYKGQSPYKKILMADSNHGIHVRKRKGEESAQTINPKKGHTDKYKTKNELSPSNRPTSANKTCLLHVPVQSYEECKVLKYYSKKYADQRPHSENESRSGGKKKHGKSIKFDGIAK